MARSGTLAAAAWLGKTARRLATAALIACATALPAAAAGPLSQNDAAIYRAAVQAAEAGRWGEAHRLASTATEQLPAKVLTWMQLSGQKPDAGFHTIADFIRAHPDWPGQPQLRRNAEMAMPPGLGSGEVRAWFTVHPPVTGTGIIRYAQALLDEGQDSRATELIRERWVSGGFNAQDEKEMLARFGRLLRQRDHEARLDRLVWAGDDAAAKRLLPLVTPSLRAVVEARLALQDLRPGVDKVLDKVPAELRNDPSLVYERLRWRRRKDQDDAAVEMLLNRPRNLGKPEAWWTEQHVMARRLLAKGDYKVAYRLAKEHGIKEGAPFAEAEFLAGWIALRYLERPSDALVHFRKLYDGVGSPISRSRGAYWAGRASEAARLGDEARRWYALAAEHPTTFYGQLALDRLGRSGNFALASDPGVPAEAASAFVRNELARVVRMLAQIEAEPEALAVFLRRLGSNAKTPVEYALVARLALEVDRPDLAVTVAKQAVQDGILMIEGGYPLIPVADAGPPEPALVLAVIRQESVFNPLAVSPVGARGLMQLMPATAQKVAGQLGLKHSHARLTADPEYNVLLGSSYLSELLTRFNGSYVLAVAAYNAGPARVAEWLQTYGDPRAEGIDVLDWIELIPFNETRNYVQRVMEGLGVYRARMNGSGPLTLVQDLAR
ncbi:lytic transglycosylase domain-containing protein [Arenibaculum pallidiluteum]|uniref:lytic transglycosylase domain-containing protein n=1 Tax=Arenibaculum pallidiluteum TaxID=2812559 RepID=UPI001A9578E0|nr:lytic transglycosylase domain-containing protein [Arenibaculum pallidiluteum]